MTEKEKAEAIVDKCMEQLEQLKLKRGEWSGMLVAAGAVHAAKAGIPFTAVIEGIRETYDMTEQAKRDHTNRRPS
jgi:hypothetical protein